MDRRGFLGSVAIGAAQLPTAQEAIAAIGRAAPRPSPLARLLRDLAGAVIPAAATQSVGAYLASVLPREFLGLTNADCALIEQTLNQRSGSPFRDLPAPRQAALVSGLDSDVFAGSADKTVAEAWRKLKRALLSVYFTTEQGASRDLEYILVPGRWEPNASLLDHPTSNWNDTFARWFS